MLPIFFITALLISAGLLIFGYMQKEKAAILIGGVILILLGVSAAVNIYREWIPTSQLHSNCKLYWGL